MTYVVETGDTLWSIADKIYGNPLLWVDLWQANRWIVDPNILYRDWILNLPYPPHSDVTNDEAIAGLHSIVNDL